MYPINSDHLVYKMKTDNSMHIQSAFLRNNKEYFPYCLPHIYKLVLNIYGYIPFIDRPDFVCPLILDIFVVYNILLQYFSKNILIIHIYVSLHVFLIISLG